MSSRPVLFRPSPLKSVGPHNPVWPSQPAFPQMPDNSHPSPFPMSCLEPRSPQPYLLEPRAPRSRPKSLIPHTAPSPPQPGSSNTDHCGSGSWLLPPALLPQLPGPKTHRQQRLSPHDMRRLPQWSVRLSSLSDCSALPEYFRHRSPPPTRKRAALPAGGPAPGCAGADCLQTRGGDLAG